MILPLMQSFIFHNTELVNIQTVYELALNTVNYHFNISGFHIVVLFNLSKELVYIPSKTTK
jgi:hypothetical protein